MVAASGCLGCRLKAVSFCALIETGRLKPWKIHWLPDRSEALLKRSELRMITHDSLLRYFSLKAYSLYSV